MSVIDQAAPTAPASIDQPWFSSREVCELSGLTYRQLDYWVRHQVIRPAIPAHGSGSTRRFSLRQVGVLVTLRRVNDVVNNFTGVDYGAGCELLRRCADELLANPDAGCLVVGTFVEARQFIDPRDIPDACLLIKLSPVPTPATAAPGTHRSAHSATSTPRAPATGAANPAP